MSKITLDELSNSLKDHLDTLGLTEEQVQGLIESRLINVQQHKLTDDNGYCLVIPNNDANQITSSGMWMGANVINGPANVFGEWVYIEAFVHNNLYQFQRATCLHDSSTEWVRHQNNGTWSEWRSL